MSLQEIVLNSQSQQVIHSVIIRPANFSKKPVWESSIVKSLIQAFNMTLASQNELSLPYFLKAVFILLITVPHQFPGYFVWHRSQSPMRLEFSSPHLSFSCMAFAVSFCLSVCFNLVSVHLIQHSTQLARLPWPTVNYVASFLILCLFSVKPAPPGN